MASSTKYGSINEDESDFAVQCENSGKTETSPLISSSKINLNEDSNIWSQLVFKWFTPILYRGNENKKLDQTDLDLIPLPSHCSTEYSSAQFQTYWNQEIRNNPSNPSLVKAIFLSFGSDFVQAGILKFIHDLCLFVGPQVLRGMILYLRQPYERMGSTLLYGLALTASVTCSQIAMSLCLRHYFFKCYSTGLRVRSGIVLAVYNKALCLSAGERQNRTLGEITNLMSIDAERLQNLTPYLHSMWSSPMQIGIALFFLWRELGLSSFGGVSVIVIMIPVSQKISEWMGGMQEKLMHAKDKRIELNGEVLAGMKVIKFQAWEESFQKRILALREIELKQLFKYFIGQSLSNSLWVFTPLAVAIATFGAYALSGHKLDVASALTSLALFEILRFPLFMLPFIINSVVEAVVSLKRIQSFLLCDEYTPIGPGELKNEGIKLETVSAVYETIQPNDIQSNPQSKELLERTQEISLLLSQLNDAEQEIQKLTGISSTEERNTNPICVRRVTLECKPGSFIAVVGSVGSGKTSLVNTILGEVKQLSGKTSVKGNLAYFSQTPFIMNASVRDNILFSHLGEPIDEDMYQRCLDCCALRHDIALLPDGDKTEIGEKGITLSGGQKARVALARVVYHRGDVTLIDDALSAVDAHVAKHLFENALVHELMTSDNGSTDTRSVVLITNAIQYLNHPRVDKIIVLHEGRIVEEGTYDSLLRKQNSMFARFISVIEKNNFSENTNKSKNVVVKPQPEQMTELTTTSSETKEEVNSNKLMTEEVRGKGQVGIEVYRKWATAAGGVIVPVLLSITFVLFEATSVLSNWWLTYWSAHGNEGQSQIYFLQVYTIIGTAAAVADLGRSTFVNYFCLQASRKLYAEMLDVILQAKMSFFDTTPVGRIVNRFSKDIYTIDEELPSTIGNYFGTLFTVLSTIVVISCVTPIFAVCLIPLIIFYLIEQAFFMLTYRELKRLDSVARSPIYALLGESVDGVAVIRAFNAQGSLVNRLVSMLDKQQHAYYLTYTAQSWLAIRLEMIGTLIVSFACLCAVFQHLMADTNVVFAGLAGLSISYALSVTQSLNWSVRMASDFEANMVAVERVKDYTKIESEGNRNMTVDNELPYNWPNNGEIVFDNVKLRYRSELSLVLKGLNLRIPGGSKVGVVGRTGAGKSTLMVALMRTVELDSGKILIDGTDTRSIGLAKLRGNIAVIPQDPVLFSGTIRTNLDPFDEHNDEKLYEVLDHVGLYKHKGIKSSTNSMLSIANVRIDSLEDKITEGGSNFSVGQRQLIVIARSLLRGANIVIMDEATAAIDAETDSIIQKVLRTEFINATCITVAHRLNTVMDSDYILVLKDGIVAEFDSPKNLLQQRGMFYDLVQAGGNSFID